MIKRTFLLVAIGIISCGLYSQNRISGNVSYANTSLTYLDSVSVFLIQGGALVAQTTTDSSGHFVFTGLTNGSYNLTGICYKSWGGGNSTDAAAIIKHFVHLTTLTGIRAEAANVDASAQVTTLDALMVSRRFVHLLDSFPAGNWVIEDKSITLNGLPLFVNLKATCYGDVNTSFIPPSGFSCGNVLTDNRDDQTYPTVLIGEQCWMAKNLNVGTFIYGVGNQTSNYVIEKFCYNNSIANCNAFGGLYQWHEMMAYDTAASSQGICPSGWHIPSDVEWDTLVNNLGGVNIAGAALKAGGGSGFEALLAGWVFSCQKFRQLGIQAFFWSSNQYYGLYAYSRILTWNSPGVLRMYESKDDGLSVRCLKD